MGQYRKPTDSECEEVLGRFGKDINGPGDLGKVTGQKAAIFEKLDAGVFSTIVEDVTALFSLVKDYANGTYREVPWNTIVAAAAGLLYLVCPIDLIPDFIPLIGMTLRCSPSCSRASTRISKTICSGRRATPKVAVAVSPPCGFAWGRASKKG